LNVVVGDPEKLLPVENDGLPGKPAPGRGMPVRRPDDDG
jgi:hypothetical protein